MDYDGHPHHIKSIFVAKLFGRYTYTIPSNNETLSDVNILYGANGTGKTTVLKLVFHLLSPSDKSGHRLAISEIPFSELLITLNDGTEISASKDIQLLVGQVQFAIKTPDLSEIKWTYIPSAQRGTIKLNDLPANVDISKLPPEMQKEVETLLSLRQYHQKLSTLKTSTYMLTADRMLQGDTVEEQSELDMQSERIHGRAKVNELVLEYRIAAVGRALNNASQWIRNKLFKKSYGIELSSSGLYQEVIKKIAKTTYKTRGGLNKAQEIKVRANISSAIEDLDKRSQEVSALGFGFTGISSDILPAVQKTSGNRLHLINSILEPYLGGLKARLDSIDPLFQLTRKVVSIANEFFDDKELIFTPLDGFKIRLKNEKTEILPKQLSSGEQQLVLLLCHVLTTRDTPSIFIIDEPEISLNIIWQRKLISSLQALSLGADIQLLFASHSMEILTKHRKRVISLVAA